MSTQLSGTDLPVSHPFDLDAPLDAAGFDIDLFAEETLESGYLCQTNVCSFTLSTVTCDCLTTLSTIFCASSGSSSC